MAVETLLKSVPTVQYSLEQRKMLRVSSVTTSLHISRLRWTLL